VTIKTLRHYDRLDLLKPAAVDQFTGHRYYTLAQVARLNRILALKEMGLSLKQIGDMLDDDLSPEQVRGILRLKQVELADEVQQAQARLRRVENRIQLMEKENDMSDYEVIVKQVQPQQALSIRQRADAAEIEGLFAEVGAALAEHQVNPSGPWIALYHHEGFRSDNLDIEIAVPVDETVDAVPMSDGRELIVRQLEAFDTVATVVENGHNESWAGSYGQLGQWLETNAYEITLPTREVFLTKPDDPAGWQIEIQFPVQKKA
jgi:DNA-binding transcriptional MerR regulator